MYNLYAIGNHSLAEVHGMLNEKYTLKVLQFDKKLEKPTSKRVVILCPTIALFNANREILNQCKQASVIVFDTAVKCEYLKPVEMLDVEKKRSSYVYKFKPLEPLVLRKKIELQTDVEVSGKNVDLIPKLLSQTHDSFVGHIINFLYRIQDSEAREKVKLMVFVSLSENKITELADKLEKKYKRNELVKSFIKMLREGKLDGFAKSLQEMTLGIKGKKALRAQDAEAKLKATNYKKLSKVHGVSKFDLQYSARYISRALSTQQTI